jgi:NTP pyrophosphatase (non-canonical NTP hydrolase)
MQQNKISYLTAKLQEEAAEVIQAVSKVNRFGPDNSHPDRQTTNKQELVGEIEDFLAILGVLEQLEYFDLTLSRNNIVTKAQALLKG